MKRPERNSSKNVSLGTNLNFERLKSVSTPRRIRFKKEHTATNLTVTEPLGEKTKMLTPRY